MCGGNEAAIQKMLAFGRELKMMSQKLRKEFGKNEANKKALQVNSYRYGFYVVNMTKL